MVTLSYDDKDHVKVTFEVPDGLSYPDFVRQLYYFSLAIGYQEETVKSIIDVTQF